jgi:hypothetical protein
MAAEGGTESHAPVQLRLNDYFIAANSVLKGRSFSCAVASL